MCDNKCPHFESCDAPLCPEDPNNKLRSWFRDEPICKRRDYSSINWIKKQKRMAKSSKHLDTYYYVEMLPYCGVSTKGFDPDSDTPPYQLLADWMAKKSKTPKTRGFRAKKPEKYADELPHALPDGIETPFLPNTP